jgi:hypothetical protein
MNVTLPLSDVMPANSDRVRDVPVCRGERSIGIAIDPDEEQPLDDPTSLPHDVQIRAFRREPTCITIRVETSRLATYMRSVILEPAALRLDKPPASPLTKPDAPHAQERFHSTSSSLSYCRTKGNAQGIAQGNQSSRLHRERDVRVLVAQRHCISPGHC